MITDKMVAKEEGIYKTLLKTAQIKAREERQERRLSFLGEGKGGFGGFLSLF